jgi:hypothetical protein
MPSLQLRPIQRQITIPTPITATFTTSAAITSSSMTLASMLRVSLGVVEPPPAEQSSEVPCQWHATPTALTPPHAIIISATTTAAATVTITDARARAEAGAGATTSIVVSFSLTSRVRGSSRCVGVWMLWIRLVAVLPR